MTPPGTPGNADATPSPSPLQKLKDLWKKIFRVMTEKTKDIKTRGAALLNERLRPGLRNLGGAVRQKAGGLGGRLGDAAGRLRDWKPSFVIPFARLFKKEDASPSFYRIRRHMPSLQLQRALVLISSMSVRYKIAGALITVLALAIASLGMVTFSRQKKILETEMKRRAEVLAQQLSNVGKEGLLTKQELGVYGAIKELQKGAGVVYAMVVDANGKVFAHNILPEQGKVLSEPADLKALEAEDVLFQETVYAAEPVLEAALPIMSKALNIKIGTARVGLSMKELENEIRRQKLIFIGISLVFVVIGLGISSGLAQVLTQPIYTLVVNMQEVANGDLSRQVKVYYKDEIGKLSEVFNQMILNLREKLHMEKYLSNSVIKSIKKNRDTSQLKLGGESKYVTALFSDVRGFTSMSEKMTPEEVVGVLNIYLNLQSKVILEKGGVVDKFVGDEVMAIFEGRGQEINAVQAAFEIQRYCQALNWARARAGQKQMQVGIGLNSGNVIMGNMGSEEQMNYTVIGDNINLAARLCSAAQPGQVVVSKAVADAVGKAAQFKKLDPVMVKGKEKAVEIYEVTSVKGAARYYMRRGVAVQAVYHLAGLDEEASPALAHNVGPGGCLLEVSMPLAVGSRLNVDLDLKSGTPLKGLQAVVRHAHKQNAKYYAGATFESVTDDARHQIIEWVHKVESEIVGPNGGHSTAPAPAAALASTEEASPA